MKRLTLGFLALICLFVVPIFAQQERNPFVIQGAVDAPFHITAQGFEPVEYGPGFHIDGWTFDCRNGQAVPFLAVSDHDVTHGTTQWISDYRIIRDQPRPDVQAAASCHAAVVNTGYSIYLDDNLASGFHFLTVFWTTGDGYTQSRQLPIMVP